METVKEETTSGKHLHGSNLLHKSKKSTSVLPTDFDFEKHVAKYITTGSIRHQHSRKVIEDNTGTKTTLKTWIEITQEITVPSADQLSWEDVKIAKENAKEARKEANENLRAKVQDKTSKDKANQDDSDLEEDAENEAEHPAT